MPILWEKKIETLGTFSAVRGTDWERSKWKKWVHRWDADIKAAQSLPFLARVGAIVLILEQMQEVINPFVAMHEQMQTVAVLSPHYQQMQLATASFAPHANTANPAGGDLFAGDGHILLNMVLYACAGFVISMILKYMGRGELSMIVMMITGFVILRQVIFILRELLNDVKTMIDM